MSETYHNLASGSLTQNWSDAGQITANDNWSGVPSIDGFLGQDITTAIDADPTNADHATPRSRAISM